MSCEIGTYQFPFYKERKKENESTPEKMTSSLFDVKGCELINYIKDNLKSADLKWSLFCAACNSYRYDSVLRPFPPFFLLENDNKQIDRLREVLKLCPNMTTLLKDLKANTVPSTLIDILHWVLIHFNEPSFKFIPKEEHQNIISQTSSALPVAMPDFIFSVTYNSHHQQKFALTALNKTTKLAFHGSRLDNFYSIINYGLQVSFNKVAAYGPGIYLSKEMGISLRYSPRGFTWWHSLFGNHISILALCEVIDNPTFRSERSSRRSIGSFFYDCENQSAPEKYVIVQNSDLVRVRYLFVYSSDEYESASLMETPTLLGWIRRHKIFTFLAAYVILLLGIGSSNSTTIYKYYRRFLRKFDSLGN